MVLLAVGLYLLTLVGLYFGVFLAAAADMTFRGREATVGDGLAISRERFGAIAGWAALSTAVGILLSLLEDQGGIAGAIFGRLLAIGWSLITFLAVPVIALEGTGPIETLKRSASLFRDRWGQQVTGNLAIGSAVFLLGFLPGAALIAVGIALWASAGFGAAILVCPRRDRTGGGDGGLAGPQRDLRRRALPLRARRGAPWACAGPAARVRRAHQGRSCAVEYLTPAARLSWAGPGARSDPAPKLDPGPRPCRRSTYRTRAEAAAPVYSRRR